MWKKALAFLRNLGVPGGTSPLTDQVPGLASERVAQLHELEAKLGYRFKDLTLLDRALTHKSYAHEQNGPNHSRIPDYEALEFLGDSILGFIVAEFLLLTYGRLSEGQLTKIRSHLVSTRQLHQVSSHLGLGRYLRLSRGEEKTGGREKPAILADLFESVVAAIYLDGELEPARDFILAQFSERFSALARGEVLARDAKSSLQERLHRLGRPTPYYQVLQETGPEHDKRFLVAVLSGSVELAQGSGRSKKEAEQEAASRAVARIEGAPARAGYRGSDHENPVDGEGQDVIQSMRDDGSGQAPPPQVENSE